LVDVRLVRADVEVAQLDLGLGPGEFVRAQEHVRIVVLVGEADGLGSVTPVEKSTRTVELGAMRMLWRIEKIGSSTDPVVFESGRPSTRTLGPEGSCPRPRKRERSVSY